MMSDEEEKILFWDEANDTVKLIVNNLELVGKTINDLTLDEVDGLFEDVIIKNQKEFNSNYMNNIITDFHKHSLKKYQDNLDVIEKTWGSAFAYYDLFIDNYINLSENIKKMLLQNCKDTNIDHLSTVLLYLNARAIQISNGIIVSLRNGYPDDAYSRTRTLYEILIVFKVIIKYGDEIAKRYMYYTGSGYGWAKPDIKPSNVNNKKKLNFTDLEKNCDFDKNFLDSWKIEHKNMHKLVHASPQGTFDRIGHYMNGSIIPLGATDVGIDLVAMNTIQLMNNIFQQYILIFDNTSIVISIWQTQMLQLLNDITKKMELEFKRLKKNNFDENDDNSK